MDLVVFSHKLCWKSDKSPLGFATDGGFVFHMEALCSIFNKVTLLVPLTKANPLGEVCFSNPKINIVSLPEIQARGMFRKMVIPFWVIKNLFVFIRFIRKADAVHAPIPGDIGTIGMLLAHVMNKRLFVRHCGNWFVTKTPAEKFWKWYMIKYAGGKNLFLTTGGGTEYPSEINKNISWIFSSSLTKAELRQNMNRSIVGASGNFKLIIVCRQDLLKGTANVIKALNQLHNRLSISLDIVGDGNDINYFKSLVTELGLNNKVKFHGKLSHDGVIKLLKLADIFCYPTSASEGFPKVVLEAMSCGLPVITTPVSVLAQLIPDSGAGILLKQNNEFELSENIIKLCYDLPLMQKISEAAFKCADEFSLERWAETIQYKLEESWKVSTIS